jgi:hypothetical protein
VVAVVKEARKIEMAQRLAEMLLLLEVCWREGGVAMVQVRVAIPSPKEGSDTVSSLGDERRALDMGHGHGGSGHP